MDLGNVLHPTTTSSSVSHRALAHLFALPRATGTVLTEVVQVVVADLVGLHGTHLFRGGPTQPRAALWVWMTRACYTGQSIVALVELLVDSGTSFNFIMTSIACRQGLVLSP